MSELGEAANSEVVASDLCVEADVRAHHFLTALCPSVELGVIAGLDVQGPIPPPRFEAGRVSVERWLPDARILPLGPYLAHRQLHDDRISRPSRKVPQSRGALKAGRDPHAHRAARNVGGQQHGGAAVEKWGLGEHGLEVLARGVEGRPSFKRERH